MIKIVFQFCFLVRADFSSTQPANLVIVFHNEYCCVIENNLSAWHL